MCLHIHVIFLLNVHLHRALLCTLTMFVSNKRHENPFALGHILRMHHLAPSPTSSIIIIMHDHVCCKYIARALQSVASVSHQSRFHNYLMHTHQLDQHISVLQPNYTLQCTSTVLRYFSCLMTLHLLPWLLSVITTSTHKHTVKPFLLQEFKKLKCQLTVTKPPDTKKVCQSGPRDPGSCRTNPIYWFEAKLRFL